MLKDMSGARPLSIIRAGSRSSETYPDTASGSGWYFLRPSSALLEKSFLKAGFFSLDAGADDLQTSGSKDAFGAAEAAPGTGILLYPPENSSLISREASSTS